jgi:glutathione S-transferase
MILAQAGVEWEEKIYELRDAPDFSHDPEWIKDKADGLGLDFPNLPYYIDGEIKLTQSMAICRFLARKHGLIAESDPATVRQDLAEYQILDLRTALVRLGYQEYSDEAKAKYLNETLPRHLTLLSKFLGDHEWLTGEKLNFVDFLLYDVLDWHLYLEPDCLKDYNNLAALMKRVEELPKIKAWMGSSKFKTWPLFNKVAKWGYKEADQYVRFPSLANKA